MLSSDTGFQGQINLENFEINKFDKFLSYKAALVLLYIVNLGIKRKKENTGSHSCKIAQHLPRLIAIETLLLKDEMACPWQIKKIEISFSDPQFSFLLYCAQISLFCFGYVQSIKRNTQRLRDCQKILFQNKTTKAISTKAWIYSLDCSIHCSLIDFDD